MKKVIIAGFFLVACIYILFFINREIVTLWNSNAVIIEVESPLHKEKVTVEYAMSTRFYKEDLNFSKNMDYTLIFDGKAENKIPNNYGENDFIIRYGNQYYLPFRHFKTNRRHQHNYIVYLYKKENELYVKVTVEGVNEMSFEAKMKEIPIKKT